MYDRVSRGNGSASLLGRFFPEKKQEQSKEEYIKQNAMLSMKYGVLVLAAFAVLKGAFNVTGASVTVSNSGSGRQLPIYCVDTQEKKIALTFDAAWGDG